MGKIMKEGIQYGVGGNEVIYVDSSSLSISANASSNAIGTVTLNEPTGYVALGYEIHTTGLSGSWYVQLSYLSTLKTLSFYNYGTSANTWTGYIRGIYRKA